MAVIGCCHGELDKMYDSIMYLQQRENITIDLVICCGDFQVRLFRVLRLSSSIHSSDCAVLQPPQNKLTTAFFNFTSLPAHMSHIINNNKPLSPCANHTSILSSPLVHILTTHDNSLIRQYATQAI